MFGLGGQLSPILSADWSPIREESLNDLCPFPSTIVNRFFEKSVLEQCPPVMTDFWIQSLVPTPGTF